MMTFRQSAPWAVGKIHASSVSAAVGFSSAVEATVTQSLTPSKVSALPKRPWVVQAAPEMVPVCALPEASAVLVPVPSLKP